MDDDPATWKISRLKKTLDAARVGYADVNEKSELVARVRAVLDGAADTASAPSSAPSASTPSSAPSARRAGASGDVGRILACDPSDLYGILDVDKRCDGAAIKKSYRKLALRLHPDKNSQPGAADAFKRVSAAFATLSDPRARRHHDYFGGGGTEESSGSSAAPSGGPGAFGDVDAEELFRAFFGSDDDDAATTAVAAYDFSPEALVQRAKTAPPRASGWARPSRRTPGPSSRRSPASYRSATCSGR